MCVCVDLIPSDVARRNRRRSPFTDCSETFPPKVNILHFIILFIYAYVLFSRNLRRTMRGIVVDAPPPISSSGTLSMRVCVRTYRLFYVSRGEESFWRTRTRGDGVEEMRKGVVKGKQRKARWLEKWLNESDEDVEEKQPKEKEGEKEKQKEEDKEDKEEEREEVVEDMQKAEIAGVGEEKETEEGKTDKDKTKEKEEEKGKDKEGKKTDKEVGEIDTMIVEDGEIPEKEEGEIVSPSESLKNPIGIESAQDTEGLKEQDKGKAKVEDKLEPAAAVEKRSKSVSVEAMRTPDKEKEKATSQSGEDVSMETVPTASS